MKSIPDIKQSILLELDTVAVDGVDYGKLQRIADRLARKSWNECLDSQITLLAGLSNELLDVNSKMAVNRKVADLERIKVNVVLAT